VKITPNLKEPWIGMFAFGYASPEALSAILSCPDPRSVCVVSSGDGYIVRTDQPEVWEKVASHPITTARLIPKKNLIVFGDLTKLTAYGPTGYVWQTSRLSWDGLRIIDVNENQIRGTAWDSPNNKQVEFLVSLQTGQVEGESIIETTTEDESK